MLALAYLWQDLLQACPPKLCSHSSISFTNFALQGRTGWGGE